MKIKTTKTKDEVKKLFVFLSNIFYEEAKKYNEHYYTMTERYYEMIKQFDDDKDFIMYIEDNDKNITAGIVGKDKDLNNSKITMSMIAVSSKYRRKSIAKTLIDEFENRCKQKNIKNISLGARFRACTLYQKLNYSYSLMVQVYDFATINDIRNKNKYNFKEISSYQTDAYGFIFFEVPNIKKEYIDYFENNVKTSSVQYVFQKNIL